MNKTIISLVVGLVILALIVWSLGPQEIFEVLVRVNPYFFLLAAFWYFLADVNGALVLSILLNDERKLRLRDFLSSHMCGLLYSIPTPGRVGYYYAAYSLSKKLDNSISSNMGVITFIQGIYLSIRAFSCLLATIYFSLTLPIEAYRILFLLVSLFPLS
ncbi:lysylphosphatidylglycerol synthase domain-containing protein, partial [Candidatus Altiarchaeota archaeon]